jgi:RNA polymerase sigma-70 factor (ECF subfamily)
MAEPSLTVELLQRAQQGDAEARNRLFERYQPRIFQIIRILMGEGLRQSVDSGDLVQETMLEALRRLDGFEPRGPGSLIGWFKTLAHSVICAAADRRQAKKRGPGRVVSIESAAATEDAHGIDPARDSLGPLERLSIGEDSERVMRCLAELPERDRDLILLRLFAEQTWAEIAVETGRPTANAARVAFATAKARLIVLVEQLDDARTDGKLQPGTDAGNR